MRILCIERINGALRDVRHDDVPRDVLHDDVPRDVLHDALHDAHDAQNDEVMG